MHSFSLPPERYPFYFKLIFGVFVLALPWSIGSNWSVFRDGDVSWHVAAGRWILEHGRIPATDPFSFTMAGSAWVPHEWLAEVVFASAFNLSAHAGLAAVVALALTALCFVFFVHLRGSAGPVAMLAALASLYVVLLPFVMARPHVLAWPLLALWASVLMRSRDRGRPPPLALALVMLLWANLHASFILGFVVAAAIGLDSMIELRWSRRELMGWAMLAVASLAAALLNANGLAGLLHPVAISGMESLPNIGEWAPSSPQRTPFFYIVLLAGILAVAVRRPRFSPGELLLVLLTLWLAFTHIRHQSIFIILALLIVVPKLAGGKGDRAAPLFASAAQRRGGIALASAAVVALLAARLALPLVPRETASNPRGLIANIPAELRRQPVFNEYTMGGPLILAGIRPFIDGRADMYGDAFVQDYLKMVDGDERRFEQAVQRYGIGWTMLPADKRLVEDLDRSPGWRRIYSDKVGVIHVRRSPAAVGGEAPASGPQPPQGRGPPRAR